MRILIWVGLLCVALAAGAAGDELYQGAWMSHKGEPAGAIGITITASKAAVGLNVNGQERVCSEAKVTTQGNRMTITCKFTYAQDPHSATFRGVIAGNEVKGEYEITSDEPGGLNDKGSWRASRRP
jgi:hypothetical protein